MGHGGCGYYWGGYCHKGTKGLGCAGDIMDNGLVFIENFEGRDPPCWQRKSPVMVTTGFEGFDWKAGLGSFFGEHEELLPVIGSTYIALLGGLYKEYGVEADGEYQQEGKHE